MARNHSRQSRQQQGQLAEQAARWLLDRGTHDFEAARRYLSERLGASRRELPSNEAIDQALIDYQQLFHATSYTAQLTALRLAALGTMRMLTPFRPRLVGELLDGALVARTPVRLHIQADTPEQVAIYLLDRKVPYQLDQCSLRFGPNQRRELPLIRFEADQQTIELTIFGHDGPPQAPLSPVDGRPMRRLSLEEVEARVGA